ncbi:hypothetical protein C1H46_023545 [Malus baccata]|uniref:Uncharacterized protein n=1 Tax=Malus baccata TaxID=106549 RepID=A0A540LXE8_MALBA|nr:hypothetical protein C1H46_023545 [Malus baccata]
MARLMVKAFSSLIDGEKVVIGIAVGGGVGQTEVLAMIGHREGHIRRDEERQALARDGGTERLLRVKFPAESGMIWKASLLIVACWSTANLL